LIANRSLRKTEPFAPKFAKQLLVHNIRINGLKAILYCYGVSASRYIEYSAAIVFLSRRALQNSTIVEVGCGHSILPSFWQRLGVTVLVVDRNRDALKWQSKKGSQVAKESLSVVLADMRYLPFVKGAFDEASCISAIEHIPGDGDSKAAFEIGRILRDDCLFALSFPLSSRSQSHVEDHWASYIPPAIQNLFGLVLPTVLKKLKVDRTCSYFERFYSREDVMNRIVNPSRCVQEDYVALKSGSTIKFVHQKMVPTGVFTLLEYFVAKFMSVDGNIKTADAIILKLKKKCEAEFLKTQPPSFGSIVEL
jgi:SAM-dependent methyltransferase